MKHKTRTQLYDIPKGILVDSIMLSSSMAAEGTTNSARVILHSPQSSPRPASEHQLCGRCRDIDLSILVPSRHKSRTKVVQLGVASELFKDSCPMCEVISRTFQQRRFPIPNTIYYLYPFYTSQIHAYKWVYSQGLGNIRESVSFAIIDELDLGSLRRGEMWDLRDNILRSGWISPLASSSSSVGGPQSIESSNGTGMNWSG